MGMRFSWLLLVVAACSHAPHGTADASSTSVQLQCESHGTRFPWLEKGCVAASDCFVANHMVDCCGTLTAVGLNVSAQAAFTTAETKCANAYPGCGCAEGPTTTEDGKSQLGGGTIEVRCETDLCRTFVP
jgi:hypothetical protein